MIIGISGKMQSGKDTVTKIIQWLLLNQDRGTEIPFDRFDLYKESATWKNVKFADKLKDMVCLLLGCTREQLEDPKFKESTLGEEWVKYELRYVSHSRLSYCNCAEYYKKYFRSEEEAVEHIEGDLEIGRDSIEISKIELTPRLLLQLLGTECGREIIHPDIWVNATFADFANKEEWFRKETGLTRTEYLTKNGHSNEYKTLNKQFFESLPNWIISDVRFPNEARAIKERNGVLIRVERPCPTCKKYKDSFESRYCSNPYHINSHESETALDNWQDWDYVIKNDKDLKHLVNLVKETKVWDI